MRTTILATGAIVAFATSSALAQEIDLTFDEDFLFDDDSTSAAAVEADGLEFDDSIFFEEAESEAGPRFIFGLRAGTVQTKTGTFTTASDYLSLDFSGDARLDNLGFLEWDTSANLEDPTGSAQSRFDINKVILQNSGANFSWQVGKFPIGWGEIEGAPVLDVLNGGLSLATLGSDTDELPGQWFMSGDFFLGQNTLSAFVGLDPESAHAAPSVQAGREYEVGARLTLPGEGGDMAIYAARLIPQSGVLDAAGTSSSAAPYSLVGFSAHHAKGSALWEIDLAGKMGLERATPGGFVTANRVDLGLGVEYSLSNAAQLTASLAAQHWLDHAGNEVDFTLVGALPSKQTNASYQVMLTTSALNEDLSLSAFAGGATDGSVNFQALQAQFAFTSSLSLNASASQMQAAASSGFAPLDGTTTLALEAAFSF